MPVKILDLTGEAAEQKVVVENYWILNNASFHAQNAFRHLHDDRAGLLTYLQSFTTNPGSLFTVAAPFVQIQGGSDTHRSTDGNTTTVIYKNIKLQSLIASIYECKSSVSSVWRLRPPFDIFKFMQYRSLWGARSNFRSSNGSGNIMNV